MVSRSSIEHLKHSTPTLQETPRNAHSECHTILCCLCETKAVHVFHLSLNYQEQTQREKSLMYVWYLDKPFCSPTVASAACVRITAPQFSRCCSLLSCEHIEGLWYSSTF